MANKVRLGIIGLGAQGSMYAGFIQDGMVPNMEIGAVCDVDQAKAQVVESKYPGVPFYGDYIAMLDSGDVDAVVTCVPHYLHPEMGIEALRRNIHALADRSIAHQPSRNAVQRRKVDLDQLINVRSLDFDHNFFEALCLSQLVP